MKESSHVRAGLGIALVLLLFAGVALTPVLQDGDHRHFYLETSIAEVRIEANSTNSRQGTQIAVLQATKQVLPSPTPHTLTPTPPPSFTPTRTSTPQGTAPSPTPEEPSGLTRTPLTAVPPIPTLTPTKTATGQPSAIVTGVPDLDPNFACQIKTNDNLTRRINPSPAAQSIGLILAGTTLTIHPYDGSIPLNSTLWYVRIADSSGGGWALYARIDPAVGSREPLVTERYMDSIDTPCIPALRRQ